MKAWTRKSGAGQFVCSKWENAYCVWKNHPNGYVVRTSERGGAIIGKGMTPNGAWMDAANFLLGLESTS